MGSDDGVKNKMNNFNLYRHIYYDHMSNEANVNWIVQLREKKGGKDGLSKLGSEFDMGESQFNPGFSVPNVYFKGKADQNMKTVTDVDYKGNQQEISHLVKNRLGPTPNLGQVSFEVGLRKYNSHSHLNKTKEGRNQKS